ncbi:extracellular solute-binding protein family 1 [Beutenbergia cavernae DSM 12333]|uniref:Extracellular solute-binding protein family 1 n=1 Tax=Beutenbergia cavernae (strain ATCC BAA-8 / DSM 12333 / CCUG 43141 / JCM 11478 / NBRC 16432 / NCIMB 13614 / HKI 0122) TaxID=471853 RepID=C5C384_BEUC1|nr:extracellular solute-binding protein [Beutenbergia cavernae]ACQ79783.1 extracellular solute-binding protein family 1 [Beutenbergia cavernae DSM 12333]
MPSPSSLHLSRRTLLSTLGVSAAGLGLAACGAPGGGSGGSGAESSSNLRDGFSQAPVTNVPSQYSGRTNILFWAPFTGVNFEVVQEQFTAFNDSQDEIYAAAESQADYATLNQKFTAALQARQVPDIVCFPEMQWLQFHFSDALAPLDGYFDDEWSLDVYLDNYVGEGVAAGQTYVVPFARSTPLFYFNKTRFLELGLPETGPATWDEFAEFAPELKSISVAGQPLMPMAFGTGDNWYGQAHAWAWGGALSDDLTVTVDSEQMHDWLTWKAGFIHDDGFGYMAQSAMTDFQTGLAAACHGSTASLRGATEASDFEIGTAFMLGKLEDSTKVPTGGSGLSIVKAESQERQDACAELFRFLADPEMSAQWHAGTGYLPIVKASHDTATVQDLVAADPNFGVALAQLPNAQTADQPVWYQSGATELGAAMAQVYGDNADVAGVLGGLQATFEEVIEDNREDLEEVMSA